MTRISIIASLLLAATAASAGPLDGEWLQGDGKAKVRFSDCGGAVCGAISWLKEPERAAGKVGQRVFFDMKPAGDNHWEGSAFNPEDGRTYSGKLTLSGDHLATSGCVLGGLICKSVNWTRAR